MFVGLTHIKPANPVLTLGFLGLHGPSVDIDGDGLFGSAGLNQRHAAFVA